MEQIIFDECTKSSKWCTVKTAVFGANSSLPHLIDRGDKLVRSADEKPLLFSACSDTKQCRNDF